MKLRENLLDFEVIGDETFGHEIQDLPSYGVPARSVRNQHKQKGVAIRQQDSAHLMNHRG
jgi:hypothetical protein